MMSLKISILWFILNFCIDGHVASEENPYLKAVSENYLAQNTAHGYVEVRPGVHLFYWLYHADGTTKNASQKPLIIWLQGGPGYAASTVGNFFEFGPLTMDFKPRNHTWVKGRNILLIDYPVGVGFSYATSNDLYAKTNHEMVTDLLQVIKGFYKQHPTFQTTPTYVIGQSYGGKLCPMLALLLNTDIENKKLKMNFKGIAIGSGYVYPYVSIYETVNLYYYMGFIDQVTLFRAKRLVHEMLTLIEKSDYAQAGNISTYVIGTIMHEELRNFIHLFKPSRLEELKNFSSTVNDFIKPILNVNQSINYTYDNFDTYLAVASEFMVPSYSSLETILNTTNLKVVVYNGNFDPLAPIAGASDWVSNLNWPLKDNFTNVERLPIRGVDNGYYKVMEQFSFWSVFRAGHWAPDDNPEAMEHILEYLMTESSSSTYPLNYTESTI